MGKILNSTGHTMLINNIVKSKGVYVEDEFGKKYMDLEAGVWCLSLGHNHERINDVIKYQLDKIMHTGFCYTNKLVEKSAERILEIAKMPKGKCAFLSSGSEAIEIGRQACKYITNKKTSMTLHDSYLGMYSSVMDRTNNWFVFNWNNCKTCSKEKCIKECELIKNIPEDISEFTFEPGSSSGFVRFPPKKLIQNIIEVVRKNGGKIIANEVTTGIGRTGKWYGFEHYDIVPDIIASGKGIGNGYPVSVAIFNNDISDELEKTDFRYNQSHYNDPLGALVSSEVIKEIEKNKLIQIAEKNGKRFLQELENLVDGNVITEVRGRGLMFAIDFADEKKCEATYKKLIENGFIVCYRGNLLRIDPPLIIEVEEFMKFIEVLSKLIKY